VLLAPFLSVAATTIPKGHHGKNRSWAGVNSFFLHAFPEYVCPNSTYDQLALIADT
jgi:hypothetical protein